MAGPQSISEFELALGEVRRLRFRLRKKSNGSFLNLNMCTYITLEANRCGEVPMTPLRADRDSGVDDWVAGLVTFLASPADLSARTGTYGYNIIAYAFNGDENPVFPGGNVETVRRTSVLAFNHAHGSWYADRSQGHRCGSVIMAGMPIMMVGDTVMPAMSRCDGVALAQADGSYLAVWSDQGWVEQPSWNVVAGTMTLEPGAVYYLSPGGTLSTTGTVRVGVADSETRLTFSR